LVDNKKNIFSCIYATLSFGFSFAQISVGLCQQVILVEAPVFWKALGAEAMDARFATMVLWT
jgi:hypothetical protein